MTPASKLYTPRILALSADLARFPLFGEFSAKAQLRSPTCGSSIDLGIDCDAGGQVERVGMLVSACAVGQSSAAIMANASEGRRHSDFVRVLDEIETWLAGDGALPGWAGFGALEAAHPYRGRHGALLLPWRAAIRALSCIASAS